MSTIGQVDVHCHVITGYPKPKITWYRNGIPLKLKPLGPDGDCASFSNGFYHLDDHKPPYSEHLVICDPKHEQNTGWYTCKAGNKRNDTQIRKYLNVHGK